MKIHDVSQGTLDWLNLRVGIPTASGLHNLITPEWKIREGEMPRTYMHLKLAEAWLGRPVIELGGFSIEQGTIVESEARPFFELETDQRVQEVGFIASDDGLFGCSPDGLIGDDNGLEIKCPSAQVHVKYLVNGGLPKEYAAQVHGSMYATDRPKWTFLSYRRGFPPLIVNVERDEKIIEAIGKALRQFQTWVTDARAKLNALSEKHHLYEN